MLLRPRTVEGRSQVDEFGDGNDWAAQIPAGGTVTVGLQVVTDGTAPTSPTLTIAP